MRVRSGIAGRARSLKQHVHVTVPPAPRLLQGIGAWLRKHTGASCWASPRARRPAARGLRLSQHSAPSSAAAGRTASSRRMTQHPMSTMLHLAEVWSHPLACAKSFVNHVARRKEQTSQGSCVVQTESALDSDTMTGSQAGLGREAIESRPSRERRGTRQSQQCSSLCCSRSNDATGIFNAGHWPADFRQLQFEGANSASSEHFRVGRAVRARLELRMLQGAARSALCCGLSTRRPRGRSCSGAPKQAQAGPRLQLPGQACAQLRTSRRLMAGPPAQRGALTSRG